MWSRGNPRYYQCMLDEDMIRRATSATLTMFFGWDSLFAYVFDPIVLKRYGEQLP